VLKRLSYLFHGIGDGFHCQGHGMALVQELVFRLEFFAFNSSGQSTNARAKKTVNQYKKKKNFPVKDLA
jgi:hypothetical protein